MNSVPSLLGTLLLLLGAPSSFADAEVAPLTDVALGPNAEATQSSTCNGGEAGRAIDGNRGGRWSDGTMSHTCGVPGEYSWWMVELDAVTKAYQEIHSITVYNRVDAYLSRLSYSFVEILDDRQRPVHSQKLPAGSKDPSWTLDYDPPVDGRYVRVRSTLSGGPLVIAEASVTGRPAAPVVRGGPARNIALSPDAFAFQSSTCGGGAANAVDGNTYGNLGTNAGSMAQTCNPQVDTEFSWWMVDLDAVTHVEQVIREITVYNRVDMYLSNLSYSYVEILDGSMNTVFSQKLPVNTQDPSWKFEFDPPHIGRFVRIRKYNKFAALIMAEVEVIGHPVTETTDGPTYEPTGDPTSSPSRAPIDPSRGPTAAPSSSPAEPAPTNVALGANALATQSSTCYGREAGLAIDGDTSHGIAAETCETAEPQWWMVDLDQTGETEQVIGEITVYNKNMYLSRIADAQVQVFDGDMKMVAFKDFPMFFKDLVYSWEFDPPVVARYVRLQMKTNGVLHFAEIEIMGRPYAGEAPAAPRVPSPMCPPPFDRPEGLRPEAQATLAAALEALRLHMAAGPQSDPVLNQAEIIAATDDFLANSHQLTATHDLMDAALTLVEEYEGIGGYGAPVSYGPPVLDGRQFSRTRGAPDGRELDRSMMLVQQAILDEMFHANLWGEDGVPSAASSEMIDWSYKPVVKECQDLFRGRKWWAAKYIPGLVDPPADPTKVYSELVKADYPPNWGRPTSFSNQRRAAYPIGGLYLAPGGVAAVTVPQEIVDHGGYHIQVGSHMVDCSRNGYNRQNRMTTSFPVDEATTYVANPFGGELYIRAPYGSLISTADVSVTGDVVQGATFFYSSLRNTTEEEWIDLQNSPAPWVHVVTDPFLQQWHSGPVKQQSYSFMVERARRYTVAYNAASLTAGIPPERRNTWVLFDAHTSNLCGRASVGSIGYPQTNKKVSGTVDGPEWGRYEFDIQDPVIGWGSDSPVPHEHDPEGTEVTYDIVTWHEFGHQAMHRYGFYNGGEKEALPHMSYFSARLALEEGDKSLVDPTGIDTAFMFSCCKIQNPYTYAPRYTIDRQAIEWMTRDNFRNGLPMSSEETMYQHRGHAKYADIARLTGGIGYFDEFMIEEHERWEAEGLGEGLGNGGDYWWRVSDTTWFPEFSDDRAAEVRTLRFSIKAGEDLTPLLTFWGVHHDYTLLKQMMTARNLFPSQEQKDLLLKYKSLIPQDSSSLEAIFREIWVPDITRKSFAEWQAIVDAWDQTKVEQAEAMVDDIIETFWPTGGVRKLTLGSLANSKEGHLRKSSPSTVSVRATGSRNLVESTSFDAAFGKWLSNGYEQEYEFKFERDYLGPEELRGPFKVSVKGGVVAEVEYAREQNEEIVLDEIDVSQVPTIEGLFDFIVESIDKGDQVEVFYDGSLGYPSIIKVTTVDDDDDADDLTDDIEFITIYVTDVSIVGAEDEA